MQFKLGKKARKYDPRIPHLSAILAAKKWLPPAPLKCNWLLGLPQDLGIMGNDVLGDCTCAAFYHARQVWNYNAGGNARTDTDAQVIKLYEEACGYDPHNPDSDQGGVEQDVLEYLLNTGAPINGGKRDKIFGFVEADPRNLDDLKRIIADCGVAYIGIQVPQWLAQSEEPPPLWDYHASGKQSAGGHALILAGYDLNNFLCVSWGRRYRITPAFLSEYLDEAYGILDRNWLKTQGTTPLGLTLDELEHQMHAMRHV